LRYQKKQRPVHSGRYGSIKQPYIRRLSRSIRSGDIFGLNVSYFLAIPIIFFPFVILSVKIFETHTIDRCYQEEHLEFFSRIFRSYPDPVSLLKTYRLSYSYHSMSSVYWHTPSFYHFKLRFSKTVPTKKSLKTISAVLFSKTYHWLILRSILSTGTLSHLSYKSRSFKITFFSASNIISWGSMLRKFWKQKSRCSP